MDDSSVTGSAGAPRRWTFGPAVLDESAMVLTVDGAAVEVERKSLEVLRYLLNHAGKLVSKDDLLANVWPGRIVSETVLTKSVHKLRDALGKQAQEIVATVHGYGYRLDGAVEFEDLDVPNTATRREAREVPPVPDESPATAGRRLTAIVFTDIVGYSAIVHQDEVLGARLLDRQREVVRRIVPRHGGREVETAGDSFLLEFGSALAAVKAVLEIQQELARSNSGESPGNRVVLRASVHLGDVEHRGKEVYGDGVNTAARLLPHSPEGGLALSAPVLSMIRQRIQLPVKSIGSPSLKNIASPVEIFTVDAAALPEPEAGAHASPASPSPETATARQKLFRRRFVAAFAGAIALAVVFAGGRFLQPGGSRPAGLDKSVAVLPFENLSADPENAFFTDGLQDSVIGHLARVKGLKVISRTSTMGFRGKHESLRNIGEALGVAQILEGSVQRSAGRLRVVVQLIDAATDTHLWSQEYNRDLADVFAVQADIAQRVAEAIHTQLTPQEKARIEAIPTTNQEAYDLYLKAALVERSYGTNFPKVREAIVWLDQAVALDPKFALAYAQLADMHDRLSWYGADASAQRRELAIAAADQALQLDPGLAEAHIAKALVLYHGQRDYDAAIKELEIARGIAPGNARTYYWLAPIYRRQGKWDEALVAFEQAVRLDPLSENYLQEYAGTLNILKRYAEADKIYARLVEVARDKINALLLRSFNEWLRTGDFSRAEADLKALPPNDNPACAVSDSWAQLRTQQRRYAEAAALYLSCQHDQAIPIEYGVAQTYMLAGDMKQARHYAEIARPAAQEAAKSGAQSEFARLVLGDILWMLGDKPGSRREVEQALQARKVAGDALNRPLILYGAAEAYAYMGDKERAIELLTEALDLPGVHARVAELDPYLDPLRDDPRFKKLIAGHLPPTP